MHTTHLIHRDSPLSPLYNPSSKHFGRLHNAFRRSLKRINHLKSTINPANYKTQAPMKPSGGEYLMKISIGTPPIEVIGIADTGSDLIWTQCLPCILFYNQTIPLFDPTHSSSYRTLQCQYKLCNSNNLENQQCGRNNTCAYLYLYFDGSHTAGNLASETITLGTKNPISLPNVAFGCAHDTAGIFDEAGSGIIGLGHGNLSLISQLPGSKKFSYCLVPNTINSTSKISFGKDSLVSSAKVITTPLVTITNSSGYHVTLEALSVGNETIAFAKKGNFVEGNMIVDTGTTFTFLPLSVYNGLESALGKVITAKRVKDHNDVLTLCYESIGKNITLRIIAAHFKGVDVQLKPENTFSKVKKNVVCLTMISNKIIVLGNLAQTNFLAGYDLEAQTVSFMPIDCSDNCK